MSTDLPRRSFLLTLIALFIPRPAKGDPLEEPITTHPAIQELRVRYQYCEATQSFPEYLDRGLFFKKQKNPLFGVNGVMIAQPAPLKPRKQRL